MGKQRRAVIDIGTNSTKLLVADVSERQVDPLLEESQQTRLGEGFFATHCLQPAAIERTSTAVARFAAKARQQGVSVLKVVATSAARDAGNPEDLRRAVESACGLKIQIISGDAEADFGFRGVTLTPDFSGRPILMTEVGGGSTQLILGCGGRRHFLRSYPLGTVRLLEKVPHSDPPLAAERDQARNWIKNFTDQQIAPELGPALESELHQRKDSWAVQLVGTGGTSTLLGRIDGALDSYDREKLDATCISLKKLQGHIEHLWSLPLVARKQIVGLPPNRADVILTGLLIFEGLMLAFGFPDLRVSTRGLRFGVLLDPEPNPDQGRIGQRCQAG